MSCLQTTQEQCGPIFRRVVTLPDEGDICPPHRHNFDHATAVVQGSIRLQVGDGPSVILQPGAMVLVPAEAEHSFEALTDYVEVWCLGAAAVEARA